MIIERFSNQMGSGWFCVKTYGGKNVRMAYAGYTKREATAKFREYLKSVKSLIDKGMWPTD